MKKLFILSLILISVSVFAEKRTYRSGQQSGPFVTQLVEKMGQKFQFTVKKVYNQSEDGRQGFVFTMAGSRNICEISYFEDGKQTIVKVFAADNQDLVKLDNFFKKEMQLKEEGVTDHLIDTKNTWKAPGLR